MSQDFRETFFEEAGEHLQTIENELLTLDADPEDTEALNAVFRAAHSIKGSAGMFGFMNLSGFTHHLETLLDEIRQGRLTLVENHVDLVLRSVDVIRNTIDDLASGQEDETDDPVLVAELQAAAGKTVAEPPPGEDDAFGLFEDEGSTPVPSEDEAFGLFEDDASVPDEPADDGFGLFADETANADADADEEPDADFGLFDAPEAKAGSGAGEGYGAYIDELLNGGETPGSGAEPAAPENTEKAAPEDASTPPAEGAGDNAPDEEIEGDGRFGWLNKPRSPGGKAQPDVPPKPRQRKAPATSEGSLRVSLQKIDQLVNQISELVITQAMLKETGRYLDPAEHETHLSTLEILERNTRELQESVLSVRLIPVSALFSRFPRVVRDLSRQLGKKIDLTQLGEQTELDKSLIEKLTDPLTHLVRNSIDHGIEMPEVREASGKSPQGSVVMSAAHEGGNIVLDISDDGAGLNRAGILDKARQRGIAVADDWPDEKVWNLIFEPGFSTAGAITDVSGRGVGMDVVRRNINELGGSVYVESHPGQGSRFTVKLPLTLAITEGMVVRIGSDQYVIPLASVVESLQLGEDEVHGVQGLARVIKRHGGYINLKDMAAILGVERRPVSDSEVAVVVESEGQQVALVVDELVGQQQIVIKNLESNYRQVPGFSGATVMGDGTVAFILDVAHFTAQAAGATTGAMV